jgi:4-hydroxybenzoyl-CoA reductase subunit beta
MSLPQFNLHRPQTVDEALRCKRELREQSVFMAGGTDLLPAYAQQLNVKPHVISLGRIASLTQLSAYRIGACVTVAELIRQGETLPPVIAETARTIAGPAVRESATVGGNLLLTGRCRYFNQSALYRSAHGGCMKAGGVACLAVSQKDTCYAISSGDLIPVLLVLGAALNIAGPDGKRLVPMADFYLPDGIQANVLQPSEILTEVVLPDDVFELSAGYMKLRSRSAVDFSEASVAVAIRQNGRGDGSGDNAYCRIALGALGFRPLLLTLTAEGLDGQSTDEIAEGAWKTLSPDVYAVRNCSYGPGYRKFMAKVFLKKLLARLAGPTINDALGS